MNIEKIIQDKDENKKKMKRFGSLIVAFLFVLTFCIFRLIFGESFIIWCFDLSINDDFKFILSIFLVFNNLFGTIIIIDIILGLICFIVFFMINFTKYIKRTKIIKKYNLN